MARLTLLAILAVVNAALAAQETCEDCSASVAPSMLQASKSKTVLKPEKPAKHRYVGSQKVGPSMKYFKWWSAQKVDLHLTRRVPVENHHDLVPSHPALKGLSAKALKALLAKHRGRCPISEDYELHHGRSEHGIQHAVLKSSSGKLQYVAVDVKTRKIIAQDPAKHSCNGVFLQAGNATNLTSSVHDIVGGDGSGLQNESLSEDAEPEALALNDPLVKSCKKLLLDTAFEKCGKNLTAKFLAANVEVIAGIRVQALVEIGIKAKNHTSDHEVVCAYEEPKSESASLLQKAGHDLIPFLEMNVDICNATSKDGADEGSLSAMQFMKKHGMGDTSRAKGYTSQKPRVSLLRVTGSLPDSFSQKDSFPKCFEDLVVRDQGSCGSCWAFAHASLLMNNLCASGQGSKVFANATDRYEISVQALMSCNAEGDGCEGGNSVSSDSSLASVGIVTERSFPYQCGGGDPETHFDATTGGCESAPWGASCAVSDKPQWSYDGYFDVSGEQDIMKAMGLYGAGVKLSFDVYQSFFDYTSGVFSAATGNNYGGHAVAGLGYGTHQGTPYWLIQNSWGTTWGESGFAKFKRGINLAGIEERGAVMHGHVNGGAQLPCMDGEDAGISSNGVSISCAEAADYGYCTHSSVGSTVTANCPTFCSWEELQCGSRSSGGYMNPNASPATTTTVAPAPCEDTPGNPFTGGTVSCAQAAGSCGVDWVAETCPVTCYTSVSGCILPTTTTTTTTQGECADSQGSGLYYSSGAPLLCSDAKPYCGSYGGVIQQNCPVTCQYQYNCYLPNPPPASACEDASSSGVSTGGPTLTCAQASPYCWHSTVAGNCPVTCEDDSSGCVLPEASCEDSASGTGLSSGGNAIYCDSSMVSGWDLCNHPSYADMVQAACPATCGQC